MRCLLIAEIDTTLSLQEKTIFVIIDDVVIPYPIIKVVTVTIKITIFSYLLIILNIKRL